MINVSGAKIVLAGPRYRDLILSIIHKLNTVEHFVSLEDDTDVTCDSLNLPTDWQSYETLITNAYYTIDCRTISRDITRGYG